jgi:hypothetical protein
VPVPRRSTRDEKQAELQAKYARWLQRGVSLPGKSQAGLARHLKSSEPVVSKMVRGTRPIRAHELEQASVYFGIPLPGDVPANVVTGKIISVPVVALALEGYWRENGPNMPVHRPAVEFLPHPGYDPSLQYAVEVGSPSIGLTHFLFVDVKQVARQLVPPDILHVERKRENLRQILIRRLQRIDGVLVLCDLAGTQEPIPLSQVTVKGLALASQTMFEG